MLVVSKKVIAIIFVILTIFVAYVVHDGTNLSLLVDTLRIFAGALTTLLGVF